MALKAAEKKKLAKIAYRVRQGIIQTTYDCGGSHIGGAFSQTDIMVALYYKFMKIDPKKPHWPSRDRFLLSKGHGGVGHAVILADLGFVDKGELKKFNKTGSPFGMHLDCLKVPGVDASTGSLGHGLSIGIGMAMGARLQNKKWHTYVILGDGELHGGPNWEAAQSAAHFGVTNMTVFVDRNKLCIDGKTEDIMALEPLDEKFEAFGWRVVRIDGHDFDQICDAIEQSHQEKDKPFIIIADTVKGKGVAFMEDVKAWHYGGLDDATRDKALDELRAAYKGVI
ncbi:MAG: transketolase [Candidatus Lernaella stagnicola]|nr:transketolase [Candidatus Lernaella stagnicola]